MRRKDVKGAASGEWLALTSAIVAGRSDRMRRAYCGGGGCVLLCAETDAVVSQRPGRGGESGDGSTEIEVGMGIWSENRSVGLRVK